MEMVARCAAATILRGAPTLAAGQPRKPPVSIHRVRVSDRGRQAARLFLRAG
jgi:hypothetical protein